MFYYRSRVGLPARLFLWLLPAWSKQNILEKTMAKTVLWLCLAWCFQPLPALALDIMLPQVYAENINVSGWLMSEKLDGVRGYWDGRQLLSKKGHPFHPPGEFIAGFPPFALEGEIWGGRGTFEDTVSIVKKQQPHDGWLKLRFAVFDVPEAPGGFNRRLQQAKDWFAAHPATFAFVIEQKKVADNRALQAELERVEKLGGEGLIVRRPDTLYARGRSRDILKVKSFYDTEAVVIEQIPGKGRNQGRLGSLLVELPNKIRFKIGTGFTDAQRLDPPSIGSIITFKYYGLYASGKPKFPSFLRIRTDNDL
jgi:DNA ligase-1